MLADVFIRDTSVPSRGSGIREWSRITLIRSSSCEKILVLGATMIEKKQLFTLSLDCCFLCDDSSLVVVTWCSC